MNTRLKGSTKRAKARMPLKKTRSDNYISFIYSTLKTYIFIQLIYQPSF